MNGGSITGLRDQSQHDDAVRGDVEPQHWLEEAIVEPDVVPRGWVWPTLVILLTIAWVAGMLVFSAGSLATIDPVQMVLFIAALFAPPAAIGILWLLLQRTSRAEARRFAATSRAMRAEALALDSVVATVRRSLAESRLELAEQTGSLMQLGDSATDRLRGVTAGMATQAALIEASAASLTHAADSTEHRLATVLATLPRAHLETMEIGRLLETIGLETSQRVAALDAALSAVARRGREADEVASGAAQRLAAHIARMEATSESAGARLETVIATMSDAIDGVLDRAAAAIDQSRKAITAQGDATIAMIEANGAAIERAGREGAEQLAERVRQIDTAIAGLSGQLNDRRRDGEALLSLLNDGLVGVDDRFERLRITGVERAQAVAGSVGALTQVADALAGALANGDDTARRVIATAEDVLTALDAAAREMDETLPGALDRLDARIHASRGVVAQSKPELLALVTAAESTHDAIEAIAGVVAMQRDTLSTVQQSLLDTLDRGAERIEGVRTIVDDTIATTIRFAEDAAPRLSEAMLRIRDTAEVASQQARDTLARVLPEAARDLETQGGHALSAAVDRSVTRQVAELSEIAAQAVASAADASERLSRQMLDIADTSQQLDTRLTSARAEREAADSDQFSRRVSLLIEAMNSAAIDISRSLATDVSDTAWAAYLKGDRGVFTRRAVRLIDGTQSREIVTLYDGDETFRDQVNRYIHDFEAMLRQILALRDGSPMGVTLLSSDMGKLYVVLAQAIERLRS
ncbi:hypothetical protein [Sphingomonas sp. CFBP 13720]|uniref:hypothetical protein n=1 Tax=Sphingomonas sp. CFBP 13720 TaxID=2775302 RepID=UPI00177E7EF3|nr:hypothetical protein [Sphingomonas sp. CFBP 13720]MBD8679036.1 hypothetical protein [Sphingomonas sp. CFBP 13720]